MAVFRYKMQNLLNLKARLEDQQKMVFGQALAELRAEQEKKARLEEKKADYESALRGEMNAVLKVQEIIRLQEGVATLKYHIAEQENEIRRCEARLEEERLKLAEAVRERKIQEKLREHAFAQFRKEEEAAERREIDELVSYQYGLTAGTEGQEGGIAENGEETKE